MDIISDKIVKTRKWHQCFACCRKFEPGTKMNRQVNTYDGIAAIYSCVTCHELMTRFIDFFLDDSENVFQQECVTEFIDSDPKYKGMTPEDLYIKLIDEKQNANNKA